MIRGTTVYKGAEGIQVHQGDMLESSEGGFAQLEFTGGTIVALGPSSRMYIFRSVAGAGSAKPASKAPDTNLILVRGWIKGESNAGPGTFQYSSPSVAVATSEGTVVLHADGEGCDILLESGSARLGEVGPDGGLTQVTAVKGEQFFSRRQGKGISTSPRPNPAFVKDVPRAFMDTLPTRLAHFKDTKPPEPRAEHAVSFADLQPWLSLPAGWRRPFAERFEPRLKDHEFRAQIEAHLKDYPEWGPILHPEKNQPTSQPPGDKPNSPTPR